ncbi:MAG: DNA repair protein RadA [Saprospiraceae bacterium]|nr:DNA repair protein RadA [Saprospiraceae bacterium]
MAGNKILFICNSCGYTSPKWEGKCFSCGAWNSFEEKEILPENTREKRSKQWKDEEKSGKSKPKPISEVQLGLTTRISTKDSEMDRILGGGIVPGSLILIGGQPGIGKSTLLLQTALGISKKVLYVSGEESEEQIKMRADRLSSSQTTAYILAESNLSIILSEAQTLAPDMIIIDSIQTSFSPYVDSGAGSIIQIRECTSELLRFAKETKIPVFIVGHITKSGDLAGPKLLEHIVDVVIQFEGERNYNYRILRTLKNRYGSTEELGIYEMMENGLKPVDNPSELLLSQNTENFSGSSVAATIEGLRPMLIETQALVSAAIYGTPQRSSTGYDLRRLNMILAILEKRAGLYFGQKDVFLNIAGGLKIADPAIDLAIVAALVSSLEDRAIAKNVCFSGEISLTGEIRPVKNIESRIKEANRLGFKKIFVSANNLKGINKSNFNIEVIDIGKVIDLLQHIF